MAKEITLNLQNGGTVTLDTDTIPWYQLSPKGQVSRLCCPTASLGTPTKCMK